MRRMTYNQLSTRIKIAGSSSAYHFSLPVEMFTKFMNYLHFDFQNNMLFYGAEGQMLSVLFLRGTEKQSSSRRMLWEESDLYCQ